MEKNDKESSITLTAEVIGLIILYQSCLTDGSTLVFKEDNFIINQTHLTLKIRDRLTQLIPEFAIQALELYLLGEAQ